jgi:hypothetical protein
MTYLSQHPLHLTQFLLDTRRSPTGVTLTGNLDRNLLATDALPLLACLAGIPTATTTARSTGTFTGGGTTVSGATNSCSHHLLLHARQAGNARLEQMHARAHHAEGLLELAHAPVGVAELCGVDGCGEQVGRDQVLDDRADFGFDDGVSGGGGVGKAVGEVVDRCRV